MQAQEVRSEREASQYSARIGNVLLGVFPRLKLVMLIAGLSFGVWWLLAWAAARNLMVSANLPRADALVVLGGSSTYQERAWEAARSFRDGLAPEVVLTDDGERAGWSTKEQRNPAFLELALHDLQAEGVPDESIHIVPGVVSTTDQEAKAVISYATDHGIRSVLIVTSAYHSRRALIIWRQAVKGTSIETGLVAALPGWQSPTPATWWWHRQGWRMVAGEYVKILYYFLVQRWQH